MVEAPEHRRTSSLHNVTNTLIVTKVPPSLLHSSVTPSLKDFFARHGNIEAWVPLSTFERVVVVYSTVEAAERAKEGMDWTVVEGFGSTSSNTSSTLRVYRGQYTPLDTLRNRRLRQHLPVPESNRNFLISPPGSPPVGWEQIREDPPNMETLARDLAHALENLTTHSHYDHDHGDQDGSDDSDAHGSACGHSESDSPRLPTPRDTLVIPHQRSPSGDLPSVLVSDTDYCDGVCSPPSRSGLTISQAFSLQRRTPSPRPPSRISQVKATVESMQNCFQFPSGAPRIDRTARPPLGN